MNNALFVIHSIIHSIVQQKYSFKKFIHSKKHANYSFKEFIHSKKIQNYSFKKKYSFKKISDYSFNKNIHFLKKCCIAVPYLVASGRVLEWYAEGIYMVW